MNIQTLQGSKGCFIAGTRVSVTFDADIPIEAVQKGDIVYSFNEQLEYSYEEVEEVFVHDNEDVYEFTFWNGRTLVGTLAHAILQQNNAFKEIGLFTEQDFCRDILKNLLPFKSKKYIGKMRVYNMHVKNNHTYIANGILVHNGGGGSKSSSSSSYTEEATTAQSASTAKLLELVSIGPIQGLVDGAKSIYLDETPLQSQNSQFNFQGVSWQQRSGTPSQAVISGFETISSNGNVGAEIKYGLPIVRTINTENAQAIILRIQLPSGLSYLDTNANRLGHTSVSLQVDIAYDGGAWTHIGNITITEKTTSAYERDYYFSILDSSEVELRISRITPDSDQSNLQNRTSWAGYSVESGYRLNYPNCALMGYIVNAREFGSNLPSRYVHAKGLIVDVPSNYDAQFRSYDGIWNGQFKQAYTNNPAWLIWWILTDKKNGIGAEIPAWSLEETKIDLYEISKYCDEYVSNGRGGLEPRFTFNAWIVERQNAFDLLRLICGTINAIVFWNGQNIKISQDRPRSISRVFSNANVIDGKFSYSQIPLSSKHSSYIMTYNNMNDYGKAATVTYEDTEMYHIVGNKQNNKTLLGCTSRGQAYRGAKYRVLSEKYLDWTVNFKVSLADCFVLPGDVIGIADTEQQRANYHGRVKSYNELKIVLDREINFTSDVSYTIMVTLSNGSVQNFPIVNTSNSSDTVHLIAIPEADILPNAIWVLSSTELQPTAWRILSITEDTPTIFSISAVEYNKTIYDAVDFDYTLQEELPSLIPTGEIPAPLNPSVYEYLYEMSSGHVMSTTVISWELPQDPRIVQCEVRYKKEGQSTSTRAGLSTSSSIEIQDLDPGKYSFYIRCITAIGLKSSFTELAADLKGATLKLAPVNNFSAKISNPSGITFSWTNSKQIGLDSYMLRGNGIEVQTYTTPFVCSDVVKRTGVLEYSIAARGLVREESDKEYASVEVFPPKKPVVNSQVMSDGLYINWTDCQHTWNLKNYVVYDSFTSESSSLNALSTIIQPRPYGDYVIDVHAVDIFENKGATTSYTLSILEIEQPVPVVVVKGNVIRMEWDVPNSSFPIKYYEIATGSGTILHIAKNNFYDIPPDQENTSGVLELKVRAVDAANNKSDWGILSSKISRPGTPSISIEISPNKQSVRLSWDIPTSEIPIISYEIIGQYDINGITYQKDYGRFDSTSIDIAPLSANVDSSSHTFYIRAINFMGMYSDFGENSFVVQNPNKVSVTGYTIDNNVFLNWQEPINKFFAIKEYNIYSVDSSTLSSKNRLVSFIGSIDGLFTSIFEEKAGSFTYAIQTVDVAGNVSDLTNITIEISEPSDFQVHYDLDSLFNGSKTNAMLDGTGGMIIPVLDNETWQENADRVSSELSIVNPTWEDKVDNNMRYFYSPHTADGIYIETVDVGTVISSSNIRILTDYDILEGNPNITLMIEKSVDNTNWELVSENAGSAASFVTNFRYIKYSISVSSGLVIFNRINFKVDIKQKSESGKIEYVASQGVDGVYVPFKVNFLDVSSILIDVMNNKPSGGSYPYKAYMDFEDVPSPAGFKVFALDKNGVPVDAVISYVISGV